MKKLFTVIALLLAVLAVLQAKPHAKSHYRTVHATAVYRSVEDTTFRDEDGNLWAVNDYYPAFYEYTLLLDDNGTYTTKDDVVVEVTALKG